MSIPKIIHQMWLGDDEPPQLWLDTLRNQNPGWEHRLWTDDNLPELQNRAEFDATIDLTQRSDLLRYEILFRHGGVYVDADCICLQPLDDLLVGDFFAGYDNQKAYPNRAATGVIGCTSAASYHQDRR